MAISKDLKSNILASAIVAVVVIICRLIWKDLTGHTVVQPVNTGNVSLSIPAANYGGLAYNMPSLPAQTQAEFGAGLPAETFEIQLLTPPSLNTGSGMSGTGSSCYSCAASSTSGSGTAALVGTPDDTAGSSIGQAVTNAGNTLLSILSRGADIVYGAIAPGQSND